MASLFWCFASICPSTSSPFPPSLTHAQCADKFRPGRMVGLPGTIPSTRLQHLCPPRPGSAQTSWPSFPQETCNTADLGFQVPARAFKPPVLLQVELQQPKRCKRHCSPQPPDSCIDQGTCWHRITSCLVQHPLNTLEPNKLLSHW